jgi:hypothetical protein
VTALVTLGKVACSAAHLALDLGLRWEAKLIHRRIARPLFVLAARVAPGVKPAWFEPRT